VDTECMFYYSKPYQKRHAIPLWVTNHCKIYQESHEISSVPPKVLSPYWNSLKSLTLLNGVCNFDAVVIVHITQSISDREDVHAVFHYYSQLPPLLFNEVLLREINIRFEQQVGLPVFLTGSQSNS